MSDFLKLIVAVISGITTALSTIATFFALWLTWPAFLILAGTKFLSFIGVINVPIAWFGWWSTPAVITTPIWILVSAAVFALIAFILGGITAIVGDSLK